MSDDYLLVRKAAIDELDAGYWRDCATWHEEKGYDVTIVAPLRAIADAIELSQASVVYDRDGNAWEKVEGGKYVLQATPRSRWTLIELAADYGPLSVAPPVEPGPPEPDELFTVVAVRGGDGALRRFVLVGGGWARGDGRTFTDWADVVGDGEVLSVTPPPEVPS